jgi:hypothetical protein
MTIPSMNKLSTVFPIMIDKYEQFIPNIEGMGVPDKINAIIQYLNRIGKLSNDVVADWNKVMVWVMDEGLTDNVNAKIDDMVAKGTFDTLLNGMFDEINNANTAFQTTVNSSLADIASNVKTLGAKGDGITNDTTIIQNAINNYSVIYLPKGTYCHTGLTFPTDRPIHFFGAGLDVTFLKNISSTNHSIRIESAGFQAGYAFGTKLHDFSITSDVIRTGQYGIRFKWSNSVRMDNMMITNHDRGISEYGSWNSMFQRIICNHNNYGWYVEDSNLNGTPNYRYYCSGNANQYGLYVENDLELLKWYGGELGGNSVNSIVLAGGNIISIEFDTINIEGNTGTDDVVIGVPSGSAPRNIAFRNCRFFRYTTGTNAVKSNVSLNVSFDNCSFSNYTYGLYDTGYGVTTFNNCFFYNVTTQAWINSKVYQVENSVGAYSYLNGINMGIEGVNLGLRGVPIPSVSGGSAVNNSFFVESGILKFKDNSGAIKTVTLA